MHHTQCLSDSGPSLILGQSIQPQKHSPDLAVSYQLLCKCLCRTLRPLKLIFDGAHTESSSSYLLLGEGKNREQLHHNLDDDICHHLGGWNVDIDIEAFKEAAQAFEEVEEGIII
jgi:hypothetical protein